VIVIRGGRNPPTGPGIVGIHIQHLLKHGNRLRITTLDEANLTQDLQVGGTQ